MKIAIITDQHFGVKKGSKIYHDYFQKFYNEVFFPTLEDEGISAVIAITQHIIKIQTTSIQLKLC